MRRTVTEPVTNLNIKIPLLSLDGDASGDVLQTVGIVVGVAVAIIAAIVVFIVIKRRSNIKHSKSVGGVDNPVFFTSTEKLKA